MSAPMGGSGVSSLASMSALEHPFGIGPLQFYRFFTEDPHNSFLNAFHVRSWLGRIRLHHSVVAHHRNQHTLLVPPNAVADALPRPLCSLSRHHRRERGGLISTTGATIS